MSEIWDGWRHMSKARTVQGAKEGRHSDQAHCFQQHHTVPKNKSRAHSQSEAMEWEAP